MERKIEWNSHQLDEISLVYEKAEKDESIKAALLSLEDQALAEAEAACAPGGLFATELGQVLTHEQFENMAPVDKETAVVMLGQRGLADISSDNGTATITATLSGAINKTQACTIFNLLNRLEKLDGAVQLVSPKWTLHLIVPLGGKKGLFQWEMLIMQLYPWLSVSETSSNILAEEGSSTAEAVEPAPATAPGSGGGEVEIEMDVVGSNEGPGETGGTGETAKTGEAAKTGQTGGGGAADAATPLTIIICFLFPLIGTVLYLVHRKSKPVTASTELKWTLIGYAVMGAAPVLSQMLG